MVVHENQLDISRTYQMLALPPRGSDFISLIELLYLYSALKVPPVSLMCSRIKTRYFLECLRMVLSMWEKVVHHLPASRDVPELSWTFRNILPL